MEVVNFLMENWGTIVTGVLTVVGGAAMIASITPTPKDDAFWAKVKKVIDTLAFNVGQAKNKE